MNSNKKSPSYKNSIPAYKTIDQFLKKSKVRRTILKCLYQKGEKGCEIAELARTIRTEKTYIYSAIKGYIIRVNTDRSLLTLGLVEELSPTGRRKAKRYRLTEFGKKLVEKGF
jgi:predicted transcriptional regulator with HTH domain